MGDGGPDVAAAGRRTKAVARVAIRDAFHPHVSAAGVGDAGGRVPVPADVLELRS